jgi:hypothetical protein
MKLKSLILGSVAAAGLSTAGYAADLGVLTSLDVCDSLGLSGLTISSDTNCLQISGKVSYEFVWGNFANDNPDLGTPPVATLPAPGTVLAATQFGLRRIDAPSSLGGAVGAAIGNNDWESKVEALLKFVATSSSDFGPARVVLNLRQRDYYRHFVNANGTTNQPAGTPVAPFANATQHPDFHGLRFQDAYVQVGDTTIISAGRKGSIFNDGDDEPFNFTGLFISDAVDKGVSKSGVETGGHVIQIESSFGEGFVGKLGLETLDRTDANAGTLVGVLDYSGNGITAHISGAVDGLLDGVATASDNYVVHAGFTGTFDAFKLRAALSTGGNYAVAASPSYWNGLVSGEATFDMFKIALSAEASGGSTGAATLDTDFGFGGSIGAQVAEGIEINLGGRYFNDGRAGFGDGYQVALQLAAAVTESLKLVGEIGVYGNTGDVAPAPVAAAWSDFYGKAELQWAPGGGFTSSVAAQAQQNGAYKVTFKAAKEFQ